MEQQIVLSQYFHYIYTQAHYSRVHSQYLSWSWSRLLLLLLVTGWVSLVSGQKRVQGDISEQKISQVGRETCQQAGIIFVHNLEEYRYRPNVHNNNIIVNYRLLGMATTREKKEFTDGRLPISSLPPGLSGQAPFIRFIMFNNYLGALHNLLDLLSSFRQMPWKEPSLSSRSAHLKKKNASGDRQPVRGVPTIPSEGGS